MKNRSYLLWFLTMIAIVGISNAGLLYDFEGGGPDFTVNGTATVDNGSMRLTENLGSQTGSVIFDPNSTEPVEDFRVSFDFLALNANGADGLSFALLDASAHNSTALFAESGPGGNSLSIGIDLYDNSGEAQDGGNYFDIRLNGVVVASAIPSFTMEGTGWHHVEITFGLGLMTVVLTPEGGVPETIFDAVAVDGYTPFAALYGIGARTGGVSNEHRVDNVLFITHEDVTNPSPQNGVADVPWDAVLSWNSPQIALGEEDAYRVTIVTDSISDVNDATIVNVTETSYTPAEPLLVDTEYFWKIDIVDLSGTEPKVQTAGNWWSFKTKGITPKITVNPSNASAWPGESASFTFEATSDTELSYQWYKGGVAIPGETSNVLTITDVQESDAVDYYCVATNIHGDTPSESASLQIKHMVAHYTFDTADGTDVSGNEHNGIVHGDVSAVEGMIGGAAFFDGNGDFIEAGTWNPSEGTGQLSVSAWLKWEGTGNTWQGYIGKREAWANPADSYWHVECSTNNNDIYFQTVNSWVGTGGWSDNIGIWTHVVVTFDGAIGTMYHNGYSVSSGGFEFGDKPDAMLTIGCAEYGGGSGNNPWHGAIDDVRIYDYPLSWLEVVTLYTDVRPDDPVCLGNPVRDLNGDCRVGVEDLVMFVSEWMECNLVPDCKP